MLMSSMPSSPSEAALPNWLWRYLGIATPAEDAEWQQGGQPFVMRGGIPRSRALVSAAQEQTEQVFGFKWQKRDTFDRPEVLAAHRSWMVQRYGDPTAFAWLDNYDKPPLLIDAGCGASWSGLELFEPVLPRLRYLGIDISEAVDVARRRFAERGCEGGFVQADIANLPFAPGSVDIIFSEGVLHHTDSTEGALKSLARLLKVGGRFMFYVYRRKGPVREFTDDLLRDRMRAMTPEQAWKAMEPLTRLGIALGELNVEVDIPEAIDLLEIPAGRINLQRLFYWHVAKAFYRPDFTFDEMNHINYDWYAPRNAQRQSIEEVRTWCQECGLEIERERVEEAGITIVAVKR